jgi:hypothetical protein
MTEVEAVIRQHLEALRPFVEKYDAVGREFCPDFDGPLDLAAFDAAARVLDDEHCREAVEVVRVTNDTGAVVLDDELLANLDQRAARQKTDRAGYLRWVLTGKAPITVGGQ